MWKVLTGGLYLFQSQVLIVVDFIPDQSFDTFFYLTQASTGSDVQKFKLFGVKKKFDCS